MQSDFLRSPSSHYILPMNRLKQNTNISIRKLPVTKTHHTKSPLGYVTISDGQVALTKDDSNEDSVFEKMDVERGGFTLA